MNKGYLWYGKFASPVFIGIVVEVILAAAPPEPDYSADLPRVAPLSTDEALAAFTVAAPFRIDLVAAEPLVNDPVAVAFDEQLRMYVVEMRDYSEDKEGHLGQVRVLTDTDKDGRYDDAVVFANKLSWPTAIVCWDGGVFVGAAPDIWYLKDIDGDGQADEKRVVFTGFGKHNVQGLLNSFHWGFDNRIHGSASTCGGLIRRPELPDDPGVNVNGRDFAFDPRTLKFEATSGGGQHGMSFDNAGRKFVSSNSDHLQQVMYEENRLARNPLLIAPGPRVSIAADGPQAEVFRRSPVERWREIRTELRVSGRAPGPIEGGGRAAGYFTGATGVTIYRGDAWPEEFRGTAIVGDVGSNIVHRKRLERNGLEFIGKRVDEQSELVASTDIWFRPAQFANAPDGSLYVLDVYREVIEHPDSLPPEIKKHLSLTSGNDRGRIYRIVPNDFSAREVVVPGTLDSAQLVELLAHPNGWHRDTATRLLFTRQDQSVVPALKAHVANPHGEFDRGSALNVLAGLGALDDETLALAIERGEPMALRWCEGRTLSESIIGAIKRAAQFEDTLLDNEIAFTLADLPLADRVELAALLARRYPDDRWQRLAIQSSLHDGAELVAERLIQDARGVDDLPIAFLESLAQQAGRDPRDGDRKIVTAALKNAPAELKGALPGVVGEFCAAVAARNRTPRRLNSIEDDALRALMEEQVDAARTLIANADGAIADRVRAVQTLQWLEWHDVEELATSSLAPTSPQDLQTASIALIAGANEVDAARLILQHWSGLSPKARSAALETLCSRAAYVAVLLEAIESNEFDPRQLEQARVKLLLDHSDPQLRARAEAAFASLALSPRAEVIEKYQDALTLAGDVERGRATFRKTCAACHRLEEVGYELGPNLAAMKARGAEAIFVNVLDPNREVNPQYVNYVANTSDGRSVTGILASETATSVTFRRGEGAEETLSRGDIDELAATGMSLMPEGLEQQLDPQALADIIAYLMQTK